MPKRRYEHSFPSHDWQQIHPLLKDPAQIQYEILRSVVFWGQTPKERGAVRKVELTAVQEVKKLAQNPLIGAYRVSAALEQMGIKFARDLWASAGT